MPCSTFLGGGEGDGSLLGPRIGSFVRFQTGNWMPKTNLEGKKTTNLAEALNLAGERFGAPTKLQVFSIYLPSGYTLDLYSYIYSKFWDGDTDGDRVKEVLASGVTPKGLEATH